MRNMRGQRWRSGFALDHALGQPLEPFPHSLALELATILLDEDTKFPPRDDDGSAEEIMRCNALVNAGLWKERNSSIMESRWRWWR